ncbi:MAG: hypothetical protein MRY83_19970 [Flavobacteriales bacterium]|nr:hypothetical protein [Flavobacteriales bacterium]
MNYKKQLQEGQERPPDCSSFTFYQIFKLMKTSNLFTLLLALALPLVTKAQSDENLMKNEIGTDITVLIDQILSFDDDPFVAPYLSTYQLTYKRHFNRFSARFAIGGNTSSDDAIDDTSGEVYQRTRQDINYRIGVEKHLELSKKWNFYYGLDFRHSINNANNPFHFQNGGWRRGYDRKSYTVGIAPIIGIDFRISDRVALQTEANFVAYLTKLTEQPIIMQISEDPSQDMPSTDLIEDRSSGTNFNAPNFLVLTIRL